MQAQPHALTIETVAPPPWPTLRLLVVGQVVLTLVLAPQYARLNLAVDGWSFIGPASIALLLFALAAFLGSLDRGFHLVLSIALIVAWSLILSPAQYLAARLRQPLIDPWLARADALVGVNVGAWAAWTAQQPMLAGVLAWCYFTLLPQIVLTPVLLVGLNRLDRLWAFLLHFVVCAIGTVAALALFPAACAFQFLGFDSTLPQGRFIAQFNGLRDGSLSVVRFQDLEGLISVPSFHVACALIVCWAFRGMPLSPYVCALNAALIAATVLSGAHYLVDLPLTLILVVAAVAFERWWVRAAI